MNHPFDVHAPDFIESVAARLYSRHGDGWETATPAERHVPLQQAREVQNYLLELAGEQPPKEERVRISFLCAIEGTVDVVRGSDTEPSGQLVRKALDGYLPPGVTLAEEDAYMTINDVEEL